MKVLLSWMREFAPIEGDPAELAEAMTDLGMVVESTETIGSTWDGIIVAQVRDLRPHPKADRIQLVNVDVGDGEDLQICCGAFNMAEGDLVPLATLGTVMPNGMEIARRKLRGEWSNGMLCSAEELGLGADADGIHILDKNLTLGTPIVEVFGDHSDVLFDLDVEGNRPDALSVYGVTRDLAAKLRVEMRPRVAQFSEGGEEAASLASIVINEPEFCLRFGARVLTNISPAQSPAWMVQRLEASGMRSISAIVDISNYVMLELGQPNHTYDLELVPEGYLGVRMARDGETLQTLDDETRTLTSADGVIVNRNDEPIGLAGVMGGASTEISDSTTTVLLEAAVWDRIPVAKTSRRLGLRSEASSRFERGVDPNGIERALDRFCELAQEICGAKIASGTIVAEGGYTPTPPVTVRVARVNALLNIDLNATDIAQYLNPIGYTVNAGAAVEANDTEVTVTIPSWRPDSTREIDVIEEIARHHGYAKSGKRVPRPAQFGGLTATQIARRRLRRALLGAGYSEAMPNPFLSPGDLRRAGFADEGISLVNPLVVEESILRTSLLPGMLKAIAYNQSHHSDQVKLFEIGHTYEASSEELPNENEYIGVALTGYGADGTAAVDATKLVHRLQADLGLSSMTVVNAAVAGMHPTRAAEIVFRGKTIGHVGEVDPGVLEAYGVSGRVGWLTLAVDPLVAAMSTPAKYVRVSRYPASELDLAFVVADEVPVTDVIRTLGSAAGGLLQSVRLFDVFRSDDLGPGTRSLAFRLAFQADDRTLVEDDLVEARQKCIDAVAKRHNAILR